MDRSTPPQKNVPNHKDLAPRLRVSCDVFGTGKTAVKATLSRYVQTSTVATARLLNPINTSVNNTTRPWTDVNCNSIPQYTNGVLPIRASDAKLGALTNNAFGQVNVATRYDPETYTG